MANKSYSRRGNNEGSIYQRKDGRWVGQYTDGYKENGKQTLKYIYGKTREEVANKLYPIIGYKKLNPNVVGRQESDITVAEYGLSWLMEYKRHTVGKSSTFEWYAHKFTSHIKPGIGHLKMRDVTRKDIIAFLDRLSKKQPQIAVSTINGVRLFLMEMFDDAVVEGIIEQSPMVKIKRYRDKAEDYRKKERTKGLSPEQRQFVIENTKDTPAFHRIVLFLMFTGLRIGETLAIRWRQVDFSAGILTVDASVSKNIKFDEQAYKISVKEEISTTKTGSSERAFKLPKIVLDVLREIYSEQLDMEKKLNKKLTCPDGFVFCNKFGKRRTYSGITSYFERFKKKYDIDFEFHAHVLRHTFATIMAEQKTHMGKISMMLGHSDVKTTLSIYTHILNSRLMDESEEDKLDEAYQMLMQPNHKQHDEKRTVQDDSQDNNQQQVMQFLSSLTPEALEQLSGVLSAMSSLIQSKAS